MNRSQTLRLGVAAALAAAGGGQPAVVRAAAAISIVGVVGEDMTDVHYAMKTGMFARAGLDVTLTASNSGSAATAAVVSGGYTIAKSSVLPTFSAHLQGIPLIFVAPGAINEPQAPRSLLQINVDANYKSGADLNGKTVAAPGLADISVLAIRAWVDKTGGDWHSLRFVEIPNSALEAALVQHRVEAAIIQSPQLDQTLAAGTTKTLAFANEAIAPRFMIGGYLAIGEWAAHHTDEVRAFASTLAEATRYVNTHRRETIPYVAELTKFPPASVATMHRSTNATALEPGLFQPVIDAAAKFGIIARAFPASEILWSAPR